MHIKHLLSISVENGAHGFDLIAVEFGATKAAQNRHRSRDLTVHVTGISCYQNLFDKTKVKINNQQQFKQSFSIRS